MNHINSKNHFKFLLPVYYTKYLVLLALKLYYTTKKYIYFYYFYLILKDIGFNRTRI